MRWCWESPAAFVLFVSISAGIDVLSVLLSLTGEQRLTLCNLPISFESTPNVERAPVSELQVPLGLRLWVPAVFQPSLELSFGGEMGESEMKGDEKQQRRRGHVSDQPVTSHCIDPFKGAKARR